MEVYQQRAEGSAVFQILEQEWVMFKVLELKGVMSQLMLENMFQMELMLVSPLSLFLPLIENLKIGEAMKVVKDDKKRDDCWIANEETLMCRSYATSFKESS